MGVWFPLEWKNNPNVPNHQPEIIYCCLYHSTSHSPIKYPHIVGFIWFYHFCLKTKLKTNPSRFRAHSFWGPPNTSTWKRLPWSAMHSSGETNAWDSLGGKDLQGPGSGSCRSPFSGIRSLHQNMELRWLHIDVTIHQLPFSGEIGGIQWWKFGDAPWAHRWHRTTYWIWFANCLDVNYIR